MITGNTHQDVQMAKTRLQREQNKTNRLNVISAMKVVGTPQEISNTLNSAFTQLHGTSEEWEINALLEKIEFGVINLKKADPDLHTYFNEKLDEYKEKVAEEERLREQEIVLQNRKEQISWQIINNPSAFVLDDNEELQTFALEEIASRYSSMASDLVVLDTTLDRDIATDIQLDKMESEARCLVEMAKGIIEVLENKGSGEEEIHYARSNEDRLLAMLSIKKEALERTRQREERIQELKEEEEKEELEREEQYRLQEEKREKARKRRRIIRNIIILLIVLYIVLLMIQGC